MSKFKTKIKTKIRNWEPKYCYSYLRKTYVNNLGFVNDANIDAIFYSKKKSFLYIFGVNILMCFMFCKTYMVKV